MNDDVNQIDNLKNYLVSNQNISPVLVSGKGAEVTDEEGRNYLDLECGPGVSSVGHCHPGVVAAIKEQVDQIIHVPGRYHNRKTLDLARRLAEYAAGDMRRTYFANSGAEATEGSIKCALKHATNKGAKGYGIIALEHSFHGRTSLPLALTGIAKQKMGFGPYAAFPGIVHAPAPYCYRCPFGDTYPKCGLKCAKAVEEMLPTRAPGEVVAFIGEPILGVGGVIIPPDEYWPKIESICKRHGITFIQDEVFAGFGRTGKAFGHHHYGTKPDIVGFGKAIGGGTTLAGFIATEELGTAFTPSDHFTTFGSKSQIGIAAGHAVLDALAQERLADNAKEMGEHFLEGLKALQAKFPMMGEVRGRGLMIGIEFVADADRTPDAKRCKAFELELVKRGALTTSTGAHGNVIRITPPLVITKGQVETALKIIEEAAGAVVSGG